MNTCNNLVMLLILTAMVTSWHEKVGCDKTNTLGASTDMRGPIGPFRNLRQSSRVRKEAGVKEPLENVEADQVETKLSLAFRHIWIRKRTWKRMMKFALPSLNQITTLSHLAYPNKRMKLSRAEWPTKSTSNPESHDDRPETRDKRSQSGSDGPADRSSYPRGPSRLPAPNNDGQHARKDWPSGPSGSGTGEPTGPAGPRGEAGHHEGGPAGPSSRGPGGPSRPSEHRGESGNVREGRSD